MSKKPRIAVGTFTITELYAGRFVETDFAFLEPADDLALITGNREFGSFELSEEMLMAGDEAYHSAPKDEDGCTAMAAAFKAMLSVIRKDKPITPEPQH